TEAEIQKLIPLIKICFGEWDPKWFYSNFRNHTRFHLAIASIDDKAVGFKLGYELDNTCFYSWLGAVLPEYRKLGIAKSLMETQHEWCKAQGYRRVQTKTQNRFKEMFILNLKSGFEVIGQHLSDEGGPKIILEKKLS
ncbi:MAG: GNAT family N-acetyltransferase, partial [Pseudobdellovibrionaceae bacterium]